MTTPAGGATRLVTPEQFHGGWFEGRVTPSGDLAIEARPYTLIAQRPDGNYVVVDPADELRPDLVEANG